MSTLPMPESTYFPPLEECLNGEKLLFSWKAIFVALSESNYEEQVQNTLEEFLLEPFVLQLLRRPHQSYSDPASSTQFDTKTAAINVTPTTKKGYDIGEITEDALWLSHEAEIDRMSALRLVVLEYQTRSLAQLRSNFSDEEIVSLQEAAGEANAELTSVLPRAKSSIGDSGGGAVDLNSQEYRRIRALRLYLSERCYLVKCSGLFLRGGLEQEGEEVSSSRNVKGKGREARATCQQLIGKGLLASFQQINNNPQHVVRDSISALGHLAVDLGRSSPWFQEDGGREDLEIYWFRSKAIQIIHGMEIIAEILNHEKYLPPSETILGWFKFVDRFEFFDEFAPLIPAMHPLIVHLQSLVAVISVMLVEPQKSLEYIYRQDENGSFSQEGMDYLPYIFDLLTVRKIHQTFLNAALRQSTVASPAVLSWCMILRAIRDTSMGRREARELRQSVHAEQELHDDSASDDNSAGNWSIRRGMTPSSSAGSESSAKPGLYETFLEEVKDLTPEDDHISFFAASAIDGSNVFDFLTTLALYFHQSPADSLCIKIRNFIFALTRCSIELVDYTPEIVTTALASLVGDQNFWNLLQYEPRLPQGPVMSLVQDEYSTRRLLATAILRFPYESLPFFRIMRALATCRELHEEGVTLAARILEQMNSITFELPNSFKGYETIQEEDDTNTIRLIQDIPLFRPRRMINVRHGQSEAQERSVVLSQSHAQFTIPAGTIGRIISDLDSGPRVSEWVHQYSALKYMGKLLETALLAGDYVDSLTGETPDRDSVAEMIGMFATLLLTTTQIWKSNQSVEPREGAYRLLEEASDGLDRNRDIVTVIFKLFEEELQRQSTGSDKEGSLDILVASIQFIYALVPVLPNRVWPLLARSELLEIDGRGGRLSAILGRIEIVRCRYDFLISCTHLFQVLVEDAVNNALLRKTGSKSPVRFESKEDLGTGIPEQVLSKVLLSLTRTMVDVFESSYNWRFAVEEQCRQLLDLTSTLLHSILKYVHGVDDTSPADEKLTKALVPSSEYILESFLSLKTGHLRFRSLLRIFVSGFFVPNLTLQPGPVSRYLGGVRNALDFTTTLVNLAGLLGRQSSFLEDQLFKASPLIARLYAAHNSYCMPVVNLLEALVLRASSREGEPPSLLGHLGRMTSKNFIHVLLDLGKPLHGDEKVISVWKFLSAIVSSRQRWFSIYLLTGRPPREALKEAGADKSIPTTRTILRIALTSLSNIELLSDTKALAMLEFVSLTQNHWPWAVSDLQQKQPNFVQNMQAFVLSMEPMPGALSENESIKKCHRNRMAAYIAEILAMHLYHSRQIGNTEMASELLPSLTFYRRCAVSPPQYNSSLHGNLKNNFETIFSVCTLDKFKRTRLNPRDYGRDYFYDVGFTEKMVQSSQVWTGTREDGLREEIARANINLSLVDSQVALLHGWKLLAVELSTELAERPDLQAAMVTIVRDLLISNNRSRLPEGIFARLNQTRADFSLILMQRLIEARCVEHGVLGLLSIVWETIKSLDTSFETVLVGGDGQYYRALLKMLFLALRPHIDAGEAQSEAHGNPNEPSETATPPKAGIIQSCSPLVRIVLEVLRQVVACGFRDLVSAIHERPTESVAEDIGLVTAILQSCLCIRGLEFSHNQIVESMAAVDATRVAITLFSWSDKLAIHGDPIYGELSIRFLLEISTLPEMAEEIAIQGVLGHISNASITSYIRRANISSLSEGVGPQRCYRIWARGILILLLNLLDAVGGSISGEVAIFLNQFPKLLQQSVEAIEVPRSTLRPAMQVSRITYSLVSEVHSLALLIHVLSALRVSMAGITEVPDVKWDGGSVLESVEHWIMERAVLRERIQPIGAHEMEMAKQRPLSEELGCENRLEEKVVQELHGIREVLTGADA